VAREIKVGFKLRVGFGAFLVGILGGFTRVCTQVCEPAADSSAAEAARS